MLVPHNSSLNLTDSVYFDSHQLQKPDPKTYLKSKLEYAALNLGSNLGNQVLKQSIFQYKHNNTRINTSTRNPQILNSIEY